MARESFAFDVSELHLRLKLFKEFFVRPRRLNWEKRGGFVDQYSVGHKSLPSIQKTDQKFKKEVLKRLFLCMTRFTSVIGLSSLVFAGYPPRTADSRRKQMVSSQIAQPPDGMDGMHRRHLKGRCRQG
jgi:hypothetical protein